MHDFGSICHVWYSIRSHISLSLCLDQLLIYSGDICQERNANAVLLPFPLGHTQWFMWKYPDRIAPISCLQLPQLCMQITNDPLQPSGKSP